MTLIELLLAVCIATLIAAAAFAVYFTVTATLRRQTEHRWQSATEALETLRRDLACCLPTAADGKEPFVLDCTEGTTSTNWNSALYCATAVVPPGQPDMSRFESVRMRYSLVAESDSQQGPSLVRQTIPQTGAAARQGPVTNLLARGVAAFQIRVLTGASWTNRWKSTLKNPLPRAAQVRLAWNEGSVTEELTSWVLIPAGNVISNAASRK